MKKYLLAHDLGTSGDKASLFSVDGKLIDSCSTSYDVHYFNDNWVEQNAGDYWQAVCHSTKKLIKSSNIDPSDIGGVSFSGQMMGCICVDKEGTPLRPAIIWADLRARDQAEYIASRIELFDYYKIVGHRIAASYGLFKFMWIKDNEPEIYEKTYKMLNAKDYIVHKLTGTFCTDYSDANGCGFFDLKALNWSDQLLALSGIDRDKLPDVKPSTFCAGGVTKEASLLTGMAEGTPVIIGAGDGVASNVGAGSVSPGSAFCCMGTSAWIASTSTDPLIDSKMRTVTWAHMVPGLYSPNGTMQYACGSYNWLKNNIGTSEIQSAKEANISVYEILNDKAAESSPGSNGLTFLPYLLGERAPRWNGDAKGCFIGIKPETSRGDIIRSVLEGVALNLNLILEILRKQIPIHELTILGGGARGSLWRQIMSDMFNADILVPNVLEEAGSMGAAVCAGVGAGILDDFTAIQKFLEISERHTPSSDSDTQHSYEDAKKRFELYYHALSDAFHEAV